MTRHAPTHGQEKPPSSSGARQRASLRARREKPARTRMRTAVTASMIQAGQEACAPRARNANTVSTASFGCLPAICP